MKAYHSHPILNNENNIFNNNDIFEWEKLNKYSLKNMVRYIVRLKNKGIIDDDEFKSLIHYTCSIFVENEVQEKITKKINKKSAFYLLKSFNDVM